MSFSYTYGPSGERISQTKTPLAGGASETSYYGLNSHTDVETLSSETGDTRSSYRYTGYGENDATGFTGKDKPTATGGPEVEAYNRIGSTPSAGTQQRARMTWASATTPRA